MKDLDFDELDKAVNSLMSANDGKKSDETAAESPAPETTPVEAPSTPPAEEAAPVAATEPAAPAQSEPQAPATKPTPAVKRRGQFMDVVHPSSDMRVANKPTTPTTGRVGVTIAPPATMATEPEPTPALETPAPTPEVAPEETPKMSTDMPDPIDMHESMMAKEAASAEQAEPTEPVAEEMLEAVAPTPVVSETTPPTGSPFLSDAQVEKRPLGAAAPTGDMPTTETTPEEAKTGEATDAPQPEIAPVSVEAESTPTPTLEVPATTSGSDSIVTTVEPAPERPTPPSAISQQYKEQESTGDKDHAALYDTAAVDVPLIHPAKERSGWLWVVWTLLLIIVGALGAATLWYFKII